jgi:hypothetical protein
MDDQAGDTIFGKIIRKEIAAEAIPPSSCRA